MLANHLNSPDPVRITEAAKLLDRPVIYTDSDGYEREILAASPIGINGEIAYVQSAEKPVNAGVDVSIKFIVRKKSGYEVSSEIKSYNPYFGCRVMFLEWFGRTAILIYREKHDTYIAASRINGQVKYFEIADDWVINENKLGYWWRDSEIMCLRLPKLTQLKSLSQVQAIKEGLYLER